MKASNALKPVGAPKVSFGLIALVCLATFILLLYSGIVPLPVRAFSQEPVAQEPAIVPVNNQLPPGYNEYISKIDQLTEQLTQVQADYAGTVAELETTRAQITALQQAPPSSSDPPEIASLLEKQAALEARIAELETELDKHMNAGGLTRLGKQVDEIAKAVGWKPEIVPCSNFGVYDERILTTGKTFVYYQANDWEHSTCFTNFSGWDESKLGTGYFVAVKFEWRFSQGCSWEPNSIYVNMVTPQNAPFDVKSIKPVHLGNPDTLPLIEKLQGRGLTVDDFQDRGTWCAQDAWGLGAYQVILRLYPIDFNDLIKIMESGYVSANGSPDY